jgi:transposase InsO family protein
MKANQATWPIATMARLLGVSASGFYAWLGRAPSAHACSDVDLSTRIGAIHVRSRGTYGMPRIHAELAEQGVHVARKRVARLMRLAGLRGVSRRKWMTTTQRQAGARAAPELVQRHFSAEAPNRLWVADATFVPTRVGFLYLAVVLDVFSRRIVGWAMGKHLRTELMRQALDMAQAQRRAIGVIHHSDQGCQYTSIAFGRRCRDAGVRPSMGSVGDCFDNAMCESFFATLECELLARTRFDTHEQARQALFSFIEGWYNPHRRHSGLGYRSPILYEKAHSEANRTSLHGELSTAGQRHGRARRPAGRPWTTRSRTSNGGKPPAQNSTA